MKYSGWTTCLLGDVVTLKRGYDLPQKKRIPGDFPIITSSGRNGTHNEPKIKGPGVVTGRSGLLGEVHYVKEDFWPLNTTLYVQDFHQNDVNFIYYYLKTLNLGNYNAGSSVPTLNRNHVHNLPIRIPSIEDQKKISNILLCLDKKIELNSNMNITLEEMSETIFKRWFVDFEFPNEEGQPYKSTDGKFINSNWGMIPEGWKVSSLSSICEISSQSVNPQESIGTLFEHYSIPAYDEKKFPNFEYGDEIKSNKYKVKEGSFLVSKLNPSTKRVWDPIFVTKNAISSTEFINYHPKEAVYSSYLFSILNFDKFSDHLIQHATGSTGSRQRVKPKDTLGFLFPIPEQRIMEKYNNLINPIREKIKQNIINIEALKEVRNTLLPKLMSGEIRIPDAEKEVEECLQKSN